MKVQGGCLGGRITFEGEVDPATVAICHCTDCQSLTGSAYRANIQTPDREPCAARRAAEGLRQDSRWRQKGAHAFCPDCGSPIYSSDVSNPPIYSLRIGTLRERAQLKPARQIWCKSALPWSSDLAGIPRNDRQ
jgi:hypothetical protein